MSLYATGTITGALNATTITGTGTKWSDAKLGITNGSVLFVSSNAGVDGVYQVKRVISDTSIELAQPIYKAFTNSKYSILVAESASTAAWSNQLAATLGYYQTQMDGWQQIMTGTGDVALTAPDGTKVTIKSFTALDKDKMSVGAFGLGLKKDSLPDSLGGASGFFGAGSYAVGTSAAVVVQSSYGAERRGQLAVNMANEAFFRFCNSASESANTHPWKRILYDEVNNPIFRGYVTQRNNSSMIREWHNEAVSQVAIGAKTQFHVNMAQGDDNAVSDFLLVRRNGTNTSGQSVITFPKTGGILALQGTSGVDFKKNIDDAKPQDALDRINALRLVNYIYKDDKEERVRFGIIAEEAEKIAPQYIKHNKEYVDDVLDPITNEVIDKIYRDRPSVDVNPIVMDLLGAIQVLTSKINEQEARLLALEKTTSNR
ncbi:tail fiber domain-containing protein [Obesumbacterium proteus]|uniref:tail fiber domain-containing protein n=1 Tax=Obesumbacterium proteus TaxID=82983 RepID=UPI001F23FAB5|nr:tail fiber domain-containing protein [Obesumbacterium proteus]MCE9886800.1 tail fiber domain-containing protein [Obesumbacterium proteus]MCE9918453.1 tail fiber domain-containing protein [Obesumbacterium proteus]MCE9929078.1 tail fiber domain-containing protein [Obesumbacterium proteus]MCG2877845.1 tail fiber domain-containing protein [Obesumbacterium proteus]